MRNVDFTKVKGVDGVAKYFYVAQEALLEVLNSDDQLAFYKEIKIPKKNFKKRGQLRTVYKATGFLSQFQKNVATAIGENVSFANHVQGFVKRRSVLTNAEQHLGRKFLMNADIKNFFDTIHVDAVIKVFEDLGCDNETSKILARVCTLNGVLRQGLHTSPIISNLVAAEMDDAIKALCEPCSASYTRYSDDIAISSDAGLPTKEDLVAVLGRHGFIFNEEKFRISKRGTPQFVTGLSVFDNDSPRIPRKIKKRLRLQLYYIEKYGLNDHLEREGMADFAMRFGYNQIRGMLDYVNSVEPDLAEKLYQKLPYRPNAGHILKIFKNNPEKLTPRLKKIFRGDENNGQKNNPEQ